jgi:hypothetical protein
MLIKRGAHFPANTVALRCRCRDVARRRRHVLVTLPRAGRVAITVPPGEAVVVTRDEAKYLRHVLRAAVISSAAGVDKPETPFTATVRCVDAVEHDHAMTITSDARGWVVVATPTGGVAVFRPLEVGPLRAVLRAAIRVGRRPVPSRELVTT